MSKPEVRKWLESIEDPFIAKSSLKFDDAKFAQAKTVLQMPHPKLARFQPLVKTVLTSEDKYRVVWLFSMLLLFLKENPFPMLLAGNWEDELDLQQILEKFVNE